MTLTTEQQKKVEENLGLVGKVIKDKVHGLTSVSIYTYDDLFRSGALVCVRQLQRTMAEHFPPMLTDLYGMRSVTL